MLYFLNSIQIMRLKSNVRKRPSFMYTNCDEKLPFLCQQVKIYEKPVDYIPKKILKPSTSTMKPSPRKFD